MAVRWLVAEVDRLIQPGVVPAWTKMGTAWSTIASSTRQGPCGPYAALNLGLCRNGRRKVGRSSPSRGENCRRRSPYEAEYAAARRTVINAHYTDPMIAAEGPTGRKRGSLDPGLTGVHRRLSCPGLHVLVPNVGPPIATGRATVFPLVNPTVGGDDELIIVFA